MTRQDPPTSSDASESRVMPDRVRPEGGIARHLAGLSPTLRQWTRARDGMAAVEFALILPVMMLIYLGMTEVSFMVSTDRKLDLVARTVGDLTGRATTMNQTEMVNIMNAAEAVMAPFKTTGLKLVVSSVEVTATRNSNGDITSASGKVVWSCSRQSSSSASVGLTAGSAVTVPAGFENSGTFIQTTVDLPYTPIFGVDFLKKINNGQGEKKLGRTTPWLVRDTGQVNWSGTDAKTCK